MEDINLKTNGSDTFSKFTLANMVSLPSSLTEPTTRSTAQAQLNAESPMGKYTERMVEDILTEIFKERRGLFQRPHPLVTRLIFRGQLRSGNRTWTNGCDTGRRYFTSAS